MAEDFNTYMSIGFLDIEDLIYEAIDGYRESNETCKMRNEARQEFRRYG